MKKVIAGLIAGIVLMFSVQAFGDGISFTGKKVDGETAVTINGKEVGKAVVINGKSFAPVREITGGFGGKVESANSEVIALSTGEQKSDDKVATLEKEIKDKEFYIGKTKEEIAGFEKQAEEYKVKVDNNKSQGVTGSAETIYETLKNSAEEQKQKLAKQEKELIDLKAQLAELQK
jgi:predicted nucleotide-binding protein